MLEYLKIKFEALVSDVFKSRYGYLKATTFDQTNKNAIILDDENGARWHNYLFNHCQDNDKGKLRIYQDKHGENWYVKNNDKAEEKVD